MSPTLGSRMTLPIDREVGSSTDCYDEVIPSGYRVGSSVDNVEVSPAIAGVVEVSVSPGTVAPILRRSRSRFQYRVPLI